ncbi:hypothetical protein GLX27_001269 [Malassezia furfur]|uniref:SNARE-complex protein Syntaxin-18 N-terminal domain-containing protein n=1 Tax=Malassezia furfur TaxID=55194 RepID=A0ABY8EM47_MALFU|nr:hypothetical protein GLX27_001269 [Malassezia furfur]
MRGPIPARVDHTSAFRQLLQECESKGIQVDAPPKPTAAQLKQRSAAESWTREAYRIKRQIASLYTFLGAIRRPYLDISSKGRYSTSDWKDEDENELDTESTKDDAFAKWQHIHALTDAERDEIDFQVKLMIKKCLESVQELERGEKLRKQAVDRSLSSARRSALGPMMLLRGGAIARQQSASDAVAAYHAAVTQYLSEQLARASSIQATLQQRRVEAEQQRHQKLADGAQKVLRNGAANDASASNLRGSAGALSQSSNNDLAQELTKEQVQMFEEEASALIQSLQSELQAVQHAEQQLHDISDLQTRIMQHLQEQNEQTSQLQTEAAGHGEQVTSGNEQLRKAKERNRAANRFLSMFFVISGLLLLVMHWIG